MTLYVPVHKTGQRALPCLTKTEANLWIIKNAEGSLFDWTVEMIHVPDPTDHEMELRAAALQRN